MFDNYKDNSLNEIDEVDFEDDSYVSEEESLKNKEKSDHKEFLSIDLPKITFIYIIKFQFKEKFNFIILIIELIKFLFSLLKQFTFIIEGKLVNAITIDKNLENVYFYLKVRITTQITDYFLSRLKAYLTKMNSTTWSKKVYYHKLLGKDIEFFDNIKSSKLSTIYSEDFISLNSFLPENLFFLFTSLIQLIFDIYVLTSISKEIFFLEIVCTVAEIVKTYVVTDNTNWDEYHKLKDKKTEFMHETLVNIQTVKSFSQENKHYKIFLTINEKMKQLFSSLTTDAINSSKFITEIITTFQYVLAFHQISNKFFGMGDFLKFKQFSKQANLDISEVTRIVHKMLIDYPIAKRVLEVINYEPRLKTVKDPEFSHLLTKQKKFHPEKKIKINEPIKSEIAIKENKNIDFIIKFDKVSFGYPIKKQMSIFKELSFTIKKGEKVAFVGSSGSGKSTITQLLLRLYDPQEGNIYIDEKNIKELDIQELHRKIAIVSQEPVIFSMSLKDNLLYGIDNYYKLSELEKKIIDEKLIEKIHQSNCEFIYDTNIFSEGLETIVSANNLSGGQKQRIAICRALMKNVEFLIFDEATSALDSESESQVQAAIDKIIKESGITSIIIAHRLSTIKNSDKIYVLKNGEIVECGKHKKLYQQNGFYKKLVNRQIQRQSILRRQSSLKSYEILNFKNFYN